MKKGLLRFMAPVVALGMIVPAVVGAHADREEGSSTPVESASWVKAVDEHGDSNSIGMFNRDEANKNLVKVNGTVTAISATSITVKKGDTTTTYTFTIDSNTKIIRKFKGHATVGEVMVGDQVRVWATSLTDGTAKLIWDKSIWWVALKGVISNLNTTTKTFDLTISRKEPETGLTMTLTIPITTSSDTSYWMGDPAVAKAFTDLANGQTVKIRGTFDKVAKSVWASKITIQS